MSRDVNSVRDFGLCVRMDCVFSSDDETRHRYHQWTRFSEIYLTEFNGRGAPGKVYTNGRGPLVGLSSGGVVREIRVSDRGGPRN